MESSAGFHSKMDKALFADATATSVGAIFGTSNTTTFVESAAGIGAGGRTGLTSVVVAICFALSAFLSTFISAIPYAATAPALVAVGVMMASSFKEINWTDFADAVPPSSQAYSRPSATAFPTASRQASSSTASSRSARKKPRPSIPSCGLLPRCLSSTSFCWPFFKIESFSHPGLGRTLSGVCPGFRMRQRYAYHRYKGRILPFLF